MKSYTDIEQSRRLAEILPIESADMGWNVFVDGSIRCLPIGDWDLSKNGEGGAEFIPCWSLSALLEFLESEIDGEEGDTYQLNIEKDGTWWNVWYKEKYDEAYPIEIESTEELVDACYKMIIKLKGMNLL